MFAYIKGELAEKGQELIEAVEEEKKNLELNK